MNTKEQIKKAVATRFKTQEVEIADGVTVTLRELSRSDRRTLNQKLFVCDASGEPVEKDGSYSYKDGVNATEEWLAVTMEPQHTVEELLDPAWPDSLKLELRRVAMKLSGYDIKDAVGN